MLLDIASALTGFQYDVSPTAGCCQIGDVLIDGF